MNNQRAPDLASDPASDPASDSASEQSIVVIGNDDLQSLALCDFIQKSLQIECTSSDPLNAWKTIHATQTLVLIDGDFICRGRLANVIERLQHHFPDLRVALFNLQPFSQDESLVEWPVIKGLFYREDSSHNLEKGLQTLLQKGHWLSRRISDKLLRNSRPRPETKPNNTQTKLSRRELQILCEISKGGTNKEIARSLHVSEHTIKNHASNIFKKIGVNSRLKAAQWASQNI